MVKIYEKTFVEVSHTIGTIVYYKVNKVKIEVLKEEEAFAYDKLEVNDDYNLLSPIDIGKTIRIFEKDITFNEKVRQILRHTWLARINDVRYRVI